MRNQLKEIQLRINVFTVTLKN